MFGHAASAVRDAGDNAAGQDRAALPVGLLDSDHGAREAVNALTSWANSVRCRSVSAA
jgi:hypothetical protein